MFQVLWAYQVVLSKSCRFLKAVVLHASATSRRKRKGSLGSQQGLDSESRQKSSSCADHGIRTEAVSRQIRLALTQPGKYTRQNSSARHVCAQSRQVPLPLQCQGSSSHAHLHPAACRDRIVALGAFGWLGMKCRVDRVSGGRYSGPMVETLSQSGLK